MSLYTSYPSTLPLLHFLRFHISCHYSFKLSIHSFVSFHSSINYFLSFQPSFTVTLPVFNRCVLSSVLSFHLLFPFCFTSLFVVLHSHSFLSSNTSGLSILLVRPIYLNFHFLSLNFSALPSFLSLSRFSVWTHKSFVESRIDEITRFTVWKQEVNNSFILDSCAAFNGLTVISWLVGF